ncbi:MAG TPA: 1-acyl-sn-glycerol-3-phosphate acyltransferase [Candidatus Acidoferrales bacterium]|nr:1-acyl-sn-glycerol-3-phosphate acyltransferase [Candidatus Acidoferrales bacterium]
MGAAEEIHGDDPGIDPFGFDPAFRDTIRPYGKFLYRRYWRVRCDGVENVPAQGPALIVANHSGAIPLDAAMLAMAVDLEHPQKRLVRFLYDRFVAAMPLMGNFYNRLGSVVASLGNARLLLNHGDLVGIFPEGVAGVAKGIAHRYELQPFHTGFVRLSIELRVPIIPVVVVGAEETYPVIGKLRALGPLRDMLNVPYLPITPFFPLLGAIGMIPLPTSWHMRFGVPIRPWSSRTAGRVPSQRQARVVAERVRRHMQAMTHALLAERESVF